MDKKLVRVGTYCKKWILQGAEFGVMLQGTNAEVVTNFLLVLRECFWERFWTLIKIQSAM